MRAPILALLILALAGHQAFAAETVGAVPERDSRQNRSLIHVGE
jgi:hypothetical protein